MSPRGGPPCGHGMNVFPSYDWSLQGEIVGAGRHLWLTLNLVTVLIASCAFIPRAPTDEKKP